MNAPLDDMSPLEHARMYRDVGLQCVPAHSPPVGKQSTTRSWKRPKLDDWRKYQDEHVDDDQFADWFDEGGSTWFGFPGERRQSPQMGIICGRASGNAFVIDLDHHKHPEALEWWLDLERRGIVPALYPVQVTGGGGLQILLRWPDGSKPPTVATPGGVDVRGQGGFAMLPPSMHESGEAYRWEEGRSPGEVDIPMASPELVAEIGVLRKNSGGDDDNVFTPRQSTPSPANQFSPIGGQRIDGREKHMSDLIWGSVVGLRRDSPIVSPAFLHAECAREFTTYVAGVKTRLPDDGTSVEARLEREGRGWSEFQKKWKYAASKWDTDLADAAREPKPGPTEKPFDGEVTSPAFSDDALALKFAAQHGDTMKYVAAWSKWMIFDGVQWAADDTRLAFNRARSICREAAAECNDKSAKHLASGKTRAAVITLANDDRDIAASSEQWDADPDCLNTPKE